MFVPICRSPLEMVIELLLVTNLGALLTVHAPTIPTIAIVAKILVIFFILFISPYVFIGRIYIFMSIYPMS